ncbi:MAG: RNA-binding protein [Spirochaeta sp. LUC14_002_19_P3]|nr:MAG: RNA-binding protein [Spirochaeta sp. LUC14_002_19_P3]
MEKDLIEYIVKPLVDKPDEVEVSMIDGKSLTIWELKAAEEDQGKIIGRQGRIAKAMRTLLSASAKDSNKRFALEILD